MQNDVHAESCFHIHMLKGEIFLDLISLKCLRMRVRLKPVSTLHSHDTDIQCTYGLKTDFSIMHN